MAISLEVASFWNKIFPVRDFCCLWSTDFSAFLSLLCLFPSANALSVRLKCHCDEISHLFFPLFFTQNKLPSWRMSFRAERKNFKGFLHYNFSSPISCNCFQQSSLFSQQRGDMKYNNPNELLKSIFTNWRDVRIPKA